MNTNQNINFVGGGQAYVAQRAISVGRGTMGSQITIIALSRRIFWFVVK